MKIPIVHAEIVEAPPGAGAARLQERLQQLMMEGYASDYLVLVNGIDRWTIIAKKVTE